MKNLLAYTPETFDNLELENFEDAPLADEMDMEEGFVRGKQSRPRRMARIKTMPRRSIASSLRKPGRIPRLPQIPPRQLMRPLLPPPRIGAAASVSVFPPPADDRRPSGQSNSSGNAGGEGSFAAAPAQDLSSEHVRWVQETLNRALGLRLIVDGIMNRETRSAVRMFQERKGLPVTGLVGPDTEEALRAEGGQAAAEPFGNEWQLEAEYSTPPMASVPNYTQCDFIDPKIDVSAQYALYYMLKGDAASQNASVQMLAAIKSGRLGGIFQEDQKVPALRAQQLGLGWYGPLISTYRKSASDAACVPPAQHPSHRQEIIAFRKKIANNHLEVARQLKLAWSDCPASKMKLSPIPPKGGKCTRPTAAIPTDKNKTPAWQDAICLSQTRISIPYIWYETGWKTYSVKIRNCGKGVIDWQAKSDQSWVDLSLNQGEVGNLSQEILVFVSLEKLEKEFIPREAKITFFSNKAKHAEQLTIVHGE